MNTNTAPPHVRARLGAAMAFTWLTTACGTEAPQSSDTTTDASATVATTDAGSSTASADSSTSAGSSDTSSTSVATDASSSSGSDSGSESGSTTDGGLHDGCWDRSFQGSSRNGPVQPPWELFACDDLPTPCGDVDLWVVTDGLDVTLDAAAMTPAEVATADANLRCMLQAFRDATVGEYRLRWTVDSGTTNSYTVYSVLEGGAVVSSRGNQDFEASIFEAYRPLVAPSTFDPCIDEPDLITAMSCLSPTFRKGPIGFAYAPALDAETCIDAVPACPP
jgi:hypothetical protein